MSSLFQFLTDLAVDPDKQERFAQNPTAEITVSRLSEANQIGLTGGESAKISTAFADELQMNDLVAVMGCMCGIDPGPDPSPDPDPPSPPPAR